MTTTVTHADARQLTAQRPTAESRIGVGTIFVSSWGWEQTNVDFYIVTKATAKMVTLLPIGKRVHETLTWASETVTPDPDNILGDPIRRKIHTYAGHPSVSINQCEEASIWSGEPVFRSQWA
ncbi:hypothetical protein QEV13_08410 [Trueperella pyogenes]|uniref:Uncharacterized protein n=1 Tax=Trueperella pecoris TaxID=2733571 RepID=A0A7M1QUK1_9ACTO|nr:MULTISPECIES: hypothetical protein [Trueperella]QOQ38029.1 hypothetical protein HLG82_00255 [Trueperella pecoris]QOR45526.1 hypothetical protein INS88_09770 [Trueperella pecoris]WHU60655.1 hypothetical protein QEV13_08410 [Trueperella pyogenes]